MALRLTISIVSYNTRALLDEALSALGQEHEVIVVDNASRDGSAEMVRERHPHVRLIESERNLGFGAGHNLALAAASAPLVLLLNSDARPLPGSISRLLEVMGDPSIAACGGRLEFPDGRTQNSCCSALTLWAVFCEQTMLEKAFPSSPLFSPYWQNRRLMKRPGEVFDVEQVMGACLLFRRQERFDEDYFLYVEDTDLCLRLRRHGRIVWVKDAPFIHALGASSEGAGRAAAVARYNRGKELYFRKHRGRLAALVCLQLNRLGALLRLTIWSLASLTGSRAAREKARLFRRVLTAPLRGPALPPDSLPAPRPESRPSPPDHP